MKESTESSIPSQKTYFKKDRILPLLVGIFAMLFGLATLKAGGQVLFGGPDARQNAGNYVDFVVWFNFVAGFFYIAAGLGVVFRHRLSVLLSMGIAGATLVVFVLLGNHIRLGGLYELHTVYAMSLRSTIWLGIALYTYKKFLRS